MSDILSLDKGHARNIIAVAQSCGVLRNQLAYILATSEWETAHTQEPVKEAYWLSEQWRKDNLRYYPWYGRGFVQLTWEENYANAQTQLGLGTKLTDNPDNALDPDIAAKVLVMGSMEGWFTGKSIPDYITLQQSDYVGARRVINGTDKASEIAAIAKDFEALLLAEGYGETPVEPETPPASDDLEARYAQLEDRIQRLEDVSEDHEARIGSLEAQASV